MHRELTSHKTLVTRSTQRQYVQFYSHLLDTALASAIYVQDAERVLERLAGQLFKFDGGKDDDFLAWATTFVQSEVNRLLEFYGLHTTENRKAVRGGIRKILANARDLAGDFEHTLAEIEAVTWDLLFERIDEFVDPANVQAKMSTRLFGFATSQAMAWCSSAINQRDRTDANADCELLARQAVVENSVFDAKGYEADAQRAKRRRSNYDVNEKGGSSGAPRVLCREHGLQHVISQEGDVLSLVCGCARKPSI